MALAFSPQSVQQIEQVRSRYPTAQAACLPVLHIAQREFGHLSDEAVDLVARTLDLAPAHVHGVTSFYTMFHRRPPGAHVLRVCTSVACMLRGADEILARVEEKLGIKAGETTADGTLTLVEEECLAACADAPAAVCGKSYLLRLDTANLDQMLDQLRRKPAECEDD
jgi:NADH-quinone oxidoreductase E subunit